MEKEMATHSSILAWKTPWTEEPGRLQPLGSLRVGHNLVTEQQPPHYWGFPGGSMVKNVPLMQETQVRSLGQEHPLEKEMTIHSSILAWGILWTEEPGGLQYIGSQRVGCG